MWAQEELKVGRQHRGHLVGPADHQERSSCADLAARNRQGPGGAVQVLEGDLPRALQVFQEVREAGFVPEVWQKHAVLKVKRKT